jgi:hypothetical protein
MREVTNDADRVIARAAELASELSELIGSLRSAGQDPVTALVDVDALDRLVDGLDDPDEVVDLVASFSNGLVVRVDHLFTAEEAGDERQARRMLIDLRSSSQLLGANAIAAWCRRREAGLTTSRTDLNELVQRTRRELTVWRLTVGDTAAVV